MSTITVIDNQHVKLFYHPDTKIVHHIYQSTIGGTYLKEELNKGIELLKQYNAVKWLSDNRQIEGHTEEETEWINTDWLPRAIAAGWQYWALVVPRATMGRMNMNEFVESFHEMGVRVMVFTEPDAALLWLQKADRP